MPYKKVDLVDADNNKTQIRYNKCSVYRVFKKTLEREGELSLLSLINAQRPFGPGVQGFKLNSSSVIKHKGVDVQVLDNNS
ncbi:hypothetical protein I3271_00940 [Photobacterium leiognathi]|uniref:hypothetical protein n=1 Tax=Photobacterium leiognathi TaxID=553611 RepID=UPI001EDD8D0B|nr:hypothetical protein [Photobacterium leiognathi]MCG3883248.1 hypothetical protein [Photobacterium leiognathi]